MNLFELFVKIGVDDQATDKISQMSDKLKTGLATAAKVGAAAVTAAGGAVVGLAKKATDAYGSFEQLKGGVETLFGASADKVLRNADRAFTTAGMSVNKYMETAITGAAALINSLEGDTEEAARLMDISIQDMSDNVNKMGTTMESIQNAYRGFSRQNFTMLDNLALGYSGSKKGMEELLARAEELQKQNGVLRDYSIDSYADIVEAIHVVQQEMGITGTTAEEASGTITGSLSSVKASWDNLLVAVSSGEGIEEKLGTLSETALAFAENYFPRIQLSVSGIFEAITVALPEAYEKIKTSLSNAFSAIVAWFKAPENQQDMQKAGEKLLSDIGNGITNALDTIIPVAGQIVKAIGDGLPKAIEWLIKGAKDLITNIINWFGNEENREKLKEAAKNILDGIGKGIVGLVTTLADAAYSIITGIVDFFKDEKAMEEFGRGAGYIVGGIIASIINIAKDIFKAGASLIGKLVDYFSGNDEENPEEEYSKIGSNILTAIGAALTAAWDEIKPSLDEIVKDLTDFFSSIDWEKTGEDILSALSDAIGAAFKWLLTVPEKLQKIEEGVRDWFLSTDWIQLSKDMLSNLASGISEAYKTAKDEAEKVVKGIGDWFMSVDWSQLGADMLKSLATAIGRKTAEDITNVLTIQAKIKDWFESINWGELAEQIKDMLVSALWDTPWNLGVDAVSTLTGLDLSEYKRGDEKGKKAESIVDKVGGFFSGAGDFISGVWDGFLDYGEKALGAVGEGFTEGFNDRIEDFKTNRPDDWAAIQKAYGTEESTKATGTTQNITINVSSVPLTPSELGNEMAYALTRRAID